MKSGKRTANYPMGSVSCATMREEDLIPTFCCELQGLARQTGILPVKTRREHAKLAREIEKRIEGYDQTQEYADGVSQSSYYESESAEYDLESLFDALGEYAAPYFYFGAHPGDGADYGFWLSEGWDDEFETAWTAAGNRCESRIDHLKVSDLADVPVWFRGEVAVVNDHGNVTLYVKTSRSLREIWAVV
jgi:hypothetical protein